MRTLAPEHLVLKVSSPEPGFVVVNETFYPGWEATVDGQSAPLFRANGLMRAIPVAAGIHQVEMRFAPRTLSIGMLVSAVSAALGLGTLGWIRFRSQRR